MQAATQPAVKGNGKGAPVLMPERVGLAEAKRREWVVDAEFGITLEQVLEPAYWAHVATQMTPGDHIEVRAEDFSWVAYLVVLYAERTFAKVVLDRMLKIDASVEDQPISIKHEVKWKGTHHKFAVIRKSDSAMIQSGFTSRGAAEEWLRNHEKAQ